MRCCVSMPRISWLYLKRAGMIRLSSGPFAVRCWNEWIFHPQGSATARARAYVRPNVCRMEKNPDAQEGIDFLQKLGIRIQHKGHLLTHKLGRVNGRETVAIETLPKRKYVPNALTHVKAK